LIFVVFDVLDTQISIEVCDWTLPKSTLSLSFAFSVSVLFSLYNFSYVLLNLQVTIIVKSAIKANTKNMLDWFQNIRSILFLSRGYKLKEIKCDYFLFKRYKFVDNNDSQIPKSYAKVPHRY